MQKVIWFNHWFSAIINTIKSVRSAYPDIKIIGTNKSVNCVYRHEVDEFYLEPTDLSDAEYKEYVINFCRENHVDIFFVKNNSHIVSQCIKELNDVGAVVVCENAELSEMFMSKHTQYETIKQLGVEKIPNYHIVNNVAEFSTLYNDITNSGRTVCIKYDIDEGASSFRIVTDELINKNHLHEPCMNILSYADAIRILEKMAGKREGTFNDLMVMHYLDGPEVSVDCYNSTTKGFVAIPRYKIGNRIKEVRLTPELIEHCKMIQNTFKFKYIYNVQYRWEQGVPKLLEVNTRISGGLHLGAMCGFNLVNQLIADILGIESNQCTEDIKECIVTQYETPVLL